MSFKKAIFFALLCGAGLASAQDSWIGYDPTGTPVLVSPPYSVNLVSSNGNTFNASTGELLVRSIQGVGGGATDGITVINVKFDLADDGHFALREFDEVVLEPQQECTEEEVLSAIPEITLDLTIEEAEALIGCDAKLATGGTTLETGRIIYARWSGLTGTPNPAPGSFQLVTSPIAVSYPLSALTGLSLPTITLELHEGIVLQVMVSEGNPLLICDTAGLRAQFDILAYDLSLAEVQQIIDCEGYQDFYAMTADHFEETWTWTLSANSNSFPPLSSFYNPFAPTDNETITANFQDGKLSSMEYRGYELNTLADACTVEQLTDAFDLLNEGLTEQELLAVVPCVPNTESTTIRDDSIQTTYTWATKIYPVSPFVAPNRQLRVSVIGGVVSSLYLSRL